jgi:hypothetical protein
MDWIYVSMRWIDLYLNTVVASQDFLLSIYCTSFQLNKYLNIFLWLMPHQYDFIMLMEWYLSISLASHSSAGYGIFRQKHNLDSYWLGRFANRAPVINDLFTPNFLGVEPQANQRFIIGQLYSISVMVDRQ